MIRKKLITVLGILLPLVMLVGLVPVTVLAEEKTYTFLNPLGVIEPRAETVIADRQSVRDILCAEGTRTLRLGVTWYYKPLDGEQAVILVNQLKLKWERESNGADNIYPPGLTVMIVRPDPNMSASDMSRLPTEASGFIPFIGHPWNMKAECVYDMMARKCDAIILGTGD